MKIFKNLLLKTLAIVLGLFYLFVLISIALVLRTQYFVIILLSNLFPFWKKKFQIADIWIYDKLARVFWPVMILLNLKDKIKIKPLAKEEAQAELNRIRLGHELQIKFERALLNKNMGLSEERK